MSKVKSSFKMDQENISCNLKQHPKKKSRQPNEGRSPFKLLNNNTEAYFEPSTSRNIIKHSKEFKNNTPNEEEAFNSSFESMMQICKSFEPNESKKLELDDHYTRCEYGQNNSCVDAFFEMKEYREDFFKYMLQQEELHRPEPFYMKVQPHITEEMRSVLVDWLVEVTEEYKLRTETLYLAVYYMDRFLSCMSVVKTKFQLVGIVSLFIAAKYEEICPRSVDEFLYVTDNSYTPLQFTNMEKLILKILDFKLSKPTTHTFITAICMMNKLKEKDLYMALYLGELSLLNYKISVSTLPSHLAASCIALGRFYNSQELWSDVLATKTKYQLQELIRTIKMLNTLLKKSSTVDQQTIQEKYTQSCFMNVANTSFKTLNW